MKESKQPTSAKKILLPPLFMSTGALMYVFPFFRIGVSEMIEASIAGFLFSIFLIVTTKFEIRDNDIYLKRSKTFIFILIGLVIIRLVAKLILSSSIHVGTMAGMFWMLAFTMIVPWRIAMYIRYRKLTHTLVHYSQMNEMQKV